MKYVYVFSYKGELITSWSRFWIDKSGNYWSPLKITTFRNFVFITDFKNNKIQTFTPYDKLICEYEHDELRGAKHMLFVGDYVYVNKLSEEEIVKCRLIFD